MTEWQNKWPVEVGDPTGTPPKNLGYMSKEVLISFIEFVWYKEKLSSNAKILRQNQLKQIFLELSKCFNLLELPFQYIWG
jgi:hypothetical protein